MVPCEYVTMTTTTPPTAAAPSYHRKLHPTATSVCTVESPGHRDTPQSGGGRGGGPTPRLGIVSVPPRSRARGLPRAGTFIIRTEDSRESLISQIA
jgi:hypothetical protein